MKQEGCYIEIEPPLFIENDPVPDDPVPSSPTPMPNDGEAYLISNPIFSSCSSVIFFKRNAIEFTCFLLFCAIGYFGYNIMKRLFKFFCSCFCACCIKNKEDDVE